MTWDWQIYAGSTVTKPIQFRGQINIPLNLSTYSFNITSSQKGPRFFQNDGVGSYWGLNGYYRSYPCWRPFGTSYVVYQYGCFNINASGIFDVLALQSNPFLINPQQPDNATSNLQLASPSNPQGNLGVGRYDLIMCSAGNANPGSGFFLSSYQYPNLVFENSPQIFTGTNTFQTSLGSEVDGGTLPVYSFIDDFDQEYVVGPYIIVVQNGSSLYYVPDVFSTYNPDTSNPNHVIPNPVVLSVGGKTKCLRTFSEGNLKANPVTGNCVWSNDGNNWYYSSVLLKCNQESQQIYLPTDYYIAFSEPQDQTIMNLINLGPGAGGLDGMVQQIPGGGFLMTYNGSGSYVGGPTAFLITDDGTGYYRINWSGFIPQFIPECLGVDINGIVWALDYQSSNTGTFQNVYNSGQQRIIIEIVPPLLNASSLSCRLSNNCTLSFEG